MRGDARRVTESCGNPGEESLHSGDARKDEWILTGIPVRRSRGKVEMCARYGTEGSVCLKHLAGRSDSWALASESVL